MKYKLVLVGILAILVLTIQATSAQEITRSSILVLECPANNKVMTGLYFYNITDYAFDNFTFSYVNIEIYSNASLLITISEQIGGTDYNRSWNPIFTAVTNYCRLDIFDLGLEDKVFNATTHPYWAHRSTQEINGTTYAAVLPFYHLEIENMDSFDAVIQLDYTLVVETHGDREAEVIITPRNSTWVSGDYYYFDMDQLVTISLAFLIIGGCVGVLASNIITMKKIT